MEKKNIEGIIMVGNKVIIIRKKVIKRREVVWGKKEIKKIKIIIKV
jgi:hypothetical protein